MVIYMAKQHSTVKNWHDKHLEKLTFANRLADAVANGMGSWHFIIWQTVLVGIWMTLNLIGLMQHWDPYPFILLNLLFSTQAAYAAPIIMMSQNRQNDRDRAHAEADYQTNIEAKLEIEALAKQLNKLEVEKLDKLIAMIEDMRKEKGSS
jgi:uncharacterized membrane protein